MVFCCLFKSLSPHKGDLALLSSLKGSVLPLKKGREVAWCTISECEYEPSQVCTQENMIS
jgi:hypothetical protein